MKHAGKLRKGFAVISPERQRALARLGGQAAHLARKALISRLDNASDRCAGSNPPVTRNASCRCTDSFTISFVS